MSILLKARAAIDDPELRGLSAKSLVENLVQSGILQPLHLEFSDRTTGIYSIGPQARDSVDPIELLEAAVPSGVVCYFTALQFYGLTTQMATHHHIARLVHRSPSKVIERKEVREPIAAKVRSPVRRDPLGTLLFSYQSQPYYRTDRGAHTLAGMQLRSLNDKTIARITTREQTLLDTLHRPISCGGPSVVWEAWEKGVSDLDAEGLARLLQILGDAGLNRRVGYMLQLQEFSVPDVLAGILDNARRCAKILSEEDAIPLLPGVPSTNLEPHWGLRLP